MNDNALLKNLAVGTIIEYSERFVVTEEDHVLFCLLTHNCHPIHLDAHFSATATRHKKILVVSSFLYTVLMRIVRARFSCEKLSMEETLSIQHIAPVFHDDVIHVKSFVVAENTVKPDAGIILLETQGYKDDGSIFMTVRHRVLLR